MTKEILTFTLDNEVYGIDVSKITEIIRADYHITPIPNSDPQFLGIFQPRDSIITAIDLKYFLYGENNLYIDSDNSILHDKYYIMCDKYAWFIDTVKDIIAFDDEKIIKPSLITKTDASFVTGIYENENDLIQIIDFSLILDKSNIN